MTGPLTTVGGALLALVVCAGCWVGWQLLRQNGRILLRLDELEKSLNGLEFGDAEQPVGLPVGSAAPAFELSDLTGARKSLAQYRGQALLLIFFNPACGFCRELLPRLREKRESRSRKAGAGAPALLVISTGAADANRALFNDHDLTCPILLQKQSEVAAAYQANGTPSGYLVDAEGKLASQVAMGADALLALFDWKAEEDQSLPAPAPATISDNGAGRESRFSSRSLQKSRLKRDGLKAGTPAPEFRLPRLDGRGTLALSELRGRPLLLVFSSPGCGPCESLAPQLEKFHREHLDLHVVMISKGEPGENRAKVKEHGLTFPIVLQQQWEISRRYAMFATPIAYLIDEEGIIVHEAAVGTDAILDLLTRATRSFAGRQSSPAIQLAQEPRTIS